MLIVSGKITLKETKRKEFLNSSRDAMMQSRKAKGCRQFIVAADPTDAEVANVYEEWDGDEEMLVFRGEGLSADMRAFISSTEVKRHDVLSSDSA